jgi:hypothetical protein
MMNRGKIIKILFVALLLVGCQAAPYSYSDKFSVKVPDISQSDITLSGKHDFYGTEQILSGTKNLKQFSVLYISTGGSAVIAERLLFPHRILKGWTALGSVKVKYGVSGTQVLPGDTVDFERFSFPGNQCFHFLSAFHIAPDDQLGRYKRMVAGYYCDSSGDEISDDLISKFLNGITLPIFANDKPLLNLSDEGLFKPLEPITGRIIKGSREPI